MANELEVYIYNYLIAKLKNKNAITPVCDVINSDGILVISEKWHLWGFFCWKLDENENWIALRE